MIVIIIIIIMWLFDLAAYSKTKSAIAAYCLHILQTADDCQEASENVGPVPTYCAVDHLALHCTIQL